MKKLLIAICLLSSAIAQSQVIVYFTPTGAGNMNGSSWANAKPGTQLAGTMRFYLSYVELWVAKGTYKPNASVRDSSFYINSYLRVYGGFAGNETNINQRNIAANPTILSGDIGVAGDSTDNSYHVVKFENADSSTVLDGFIVQGGNANSASGNWDNMGGGLRNMAGGVPGTDYSSPKISNCMFKNNHADWGGGGVADFSAGVLASMRLDHCTFEYNTSGSGGPGGAGLLSYTFAGDGPVSTSVDHCTFSNNMAQDGAGGIVQMANFDNSATLYVKNSIFDHNSGLNVGAISFNSYPDYYNPNSHSAQLKAYIDSCRFTHNSATISGTSAVIGGYYSSGSTGHELRISNCTIDSNSCWSAPIDIHGYMSKTKNVIESCSFYHNATQSVGGVNITSLASHTDSTIINNSLFYNTGKQGIFYTNAQSSAHSVTLINNTTAVVDSSRYGGEGIFVNVAINQPGDTATHPCNAYMYINNTIAWHYRPQAASVNALKNFYSGNNTTADIITKNSILNMDNNAWPGAVYGTNGGNNSGSYPRFRDSANFDFRLSCGSPALNAGNNALVPQSITKDLDGHARILNTTVDIGCYETDTLPVPLAAPSVAVNNADISCTAGYNVQPDSVLWSFGDGHTSSQLNATHTYAADGQYTVCLHIYTACGADEKCDTVSITGVGLAVANPPLATVQVYPNPVTDRLMISGMHAAMNVRLCTATGTVVKETRLSAGNAALDISALPTGMYLLDMSAPAEGHRVVKIVKE